MGGQCQSCGMPLHSKRAGDCRGTEVDGTPSDKWCRLCYLDGAFLGPDCTLEQMLDIVDKALVDSGSGRVMRWMARRQIPSLERWKSR